MAVSIIPKKSSEPEFEVFEYEYSQTPDWYRPTNTFPNGTPTKSRISGNYDTDSSGYGITADVSKSGYTIAGILDAYGVYVVRMGATETYRITESFLDENTLKMKTQGTYSSWDYWTFKVKIK